MQGVVGVGRFYLKKEGLLRGPVLADANCSVTRLQINRFPNVFAR